MAREAGVFACIVEDSHASSWRIRMNRGTICRRRRVSLCYSIFSSTSRRSFDTGERSTTRRSLF